MEDIADARGRPRQASNVAKQAMLIAFHNWPSRDNRTPEPTRSLNEAVATRRGPSSCFRGEASESRTVDTSLEAVSCVRSVWRLYLLAYRRYDRSRPETDSPKGPSRRDDRAGGNGQLTSNPPEPIHWNFMRRGTFW